MSKHATKKITDLLSEVYDILEQANSIAKEYDIELSVRIESNDGVIRVINEFTTQPDESSWRSSSANC